MKTICAYCGKPILKDMPCYTDLDMCLDDETMKVNYVHVHCIGGYLDKIGICSS